MDKHAFEETGLIPRSIIRTFDRFRRQLLSGTERSMIQEFRVSKTQVLISIKCLIKLLLIPFFINLLAKNLFLLPITEYLWNTQQKEVFLNSYQEERAFLEMHDFEERMFFESLVEKVEVKKSFSLPLSGVAAHEQPNPFRESDKPSKPYFQSERESFEGLSPLLPLKGTNRKHFIKNTLNTLPKEKENLCLADWMQTGKTNGLFSFVNSLWHVNASKPVVEEEPKKPFLQDKISVLPFYETTNPEGKPLIANTFQHQQPLKVVPQKARGQTPLPINGLHRSLPQEFQQKTIELAIFYNQQSIQGITNLFGDLVTFVSISFLFVWMKPEIIVLKSFLTESVYSFSDTTKSFLLILLTDLLVGFHSPRGWEIFIELLLRHFGLPEDQIFVFLFVATFPVLLDTVFKYWIFRYLNQLSPSTVATYHTMIE